MSIGQIEVPTGADEAFLLTTPSSSPLLSFNFAMSAIPQSTFPLFLFPFLILLPVVVIADREALLTERGEFLPHIRLAKDLMDSSRYDPRVRPVVDHSKPTTVKFSMSLYQILAINEKFQHLDLNAWVIQKWHDDFLGWNPYNYGMINTTILPYNAIWLPDTYLYNSVVMNREETERYINVVVTTKYWENKRGAEVKFMYPALYRTTCRLDIRYFPYDQQNCTLVISSWTSSKSDVDYEAEFDDVNLDNFIPNEEWVVISFHIRRVEQKFVCCPEPWVLLEASLVVRRKPLYYIVNLVIPTSVITLVAVTGFFTAASTSSERREKLSLGIDSLLAMSILMMMVSEQMPTTSDIPLFGLFYLTTIIVIFVGTICTAFILNVHLQKIYSRPISPLISYIFFHKIAKWLNIRPPTSLLELWMETGVRSSSRRVTSPPAPLHNNNNRPVAVSNLVLQCPLADVNECLLKTPTTPTAPKLLDKKEKNDEVSKAANARNNWRNLARKASEKGSKGSSVKGTSNELTPLAPHHQASHPPTPSPQVPPLPTSALRIGEPTLIEVKLRRRYALEWEFLATVLDRLLLILFSLVVFVVTFLMVLIGEAMHLSYEIDEDRPVSIPQ